MRKRSKRYKSLQELIEKNKEYSLQEAISCLKKTSNTKFDSSAELHLHLNADPKKSDQMVRGVVILPHGSGKKVRIVAFCKGEKQNEAKEAGADFIGSDELVNKIMSGFLDFDCVVATADMMKEISRLGRILGPRGLMPSPKTGTVTNDLGKAISDLRRGKIEFRMDKQAGIHVAIGKMSFDESRLYENAKKVIEAISEARPAAVKGKFIRTIYLSSTMGPSFRVMF
jgi:large subunit ribosomal protein L1